MYSGLLLVNYVPLLELFLPDFALLSFSSSALTAQKRIQCCLQRYVQERASVPLNEARYQKSPKPSFTDHLAKRKGSNSY